MSPKQQPNAQPTLSSFPPLISHAQNIICRCSKRCSSCPHTGTHAPRTRHTICQDQKSPNASPQQTCQHLCTSSRRPSHTSEGHCRQPCRNSEGGTSSTSSTYPSCTSRRVAHITPTTGSLTSRPEHPTPSKNPQLIPPDNDDPMQNTPPVPTTFSATSNNPPHCQCHAKSLRQLHH
jgi:hypothetical protein